MYDLGERFKIDLNESKCNKEAVFKGKNYRISVLTERLIRLEYNNNGIFEDRPTTFAHYRNMNKPKFNVSENNSILKIVTKYFELEYRKGSPFIGGKFSPMANLKILLNNTNKIWYYNHPEARRYSTLTAINEDKVTEQVGLYSLDGFVSIDDSKNDVILENGEIQQRNYDGIDIYVFMYNKDYYFCLNDYFMLTGRPPLIPRYALGNWYSKNEYYDKEKIQKIIDEFEKNEIPLSLFILKKWSNNLNLNEFYENFNELIEKSLKNNIRFGLDIVDVTTFDGKYFDNLKKYLQPDINGNIPFNIYDVKVIDAYLKLLIHPLIFNGISLIELNNSINDKRSTALKYYLYNDQKILNKKRPFLCGPSSNVALHRYSTVYSGKSKVEWNTLKKIVEFNLTSFNIGMSFWVHDLGGTYGGIEDSELYARFIQLGVFSPITNLSCEGGKYYRREPWNWGIKTFKIAKNYLNLRYRLIPYLYTECYKYHKFGKPLIEPIYYRYPIMYDDQLYRNEYFFGSQIFISPITEKKSFIMNRVIHKLYIPDGIWYDYFTGKKYRGNRKYTSFYRDEDYPVFVKSGSIIPLASSKYNDVGLPLELELLIFPGENNTYSIYEDDGKTLDYKNGNYVITNIELLSKKNSYNLTILPVEGKIGILPKTRDYKIRFRNTRAASRILSYVKDQEVENISYRDDKDLVIEIKNVPTDKQFTLMCSGKDIEYDALKIINEDIASIISDLPIETAMKERIDFIMFAKDMSIKKKRIEIRKLSSGKVKLERKYIDLFIKLLEYIQEV